jgi:hypothetical protein
VEGISNVLIETLSWYIRRESEENKENLSQENLRPRRSWKEAAPEYVCSLTVELTCSVEALTILEYESLLQDLFSICSRKCILSLVALSVRSL